jgi:hypothetical protein
MTLLIGNVVSVDDAPLGVVGVLLFESGQKAWGCVRALKNGVRVCMTERNEQFNEQPVGFCELNFKF